MPKTINPHLTKDLLESLDPDIIDVEITHGYLKIMLGFGEVINITEQDLTTMLKFLRSNKH